MSYKRCLDLHVEEMEKSILDPGHDPYQSQNIIIGPWLKVYSTY